MSRILALWPHARRVIWGGTRLGRELGLVTGPGELPVGEVLDVSGLAEMPSRLGGPDGPGLGTSYAEDPARFLGEGVAAPERFPLLVKRIDSGRHLSVQVHPDDETALRLEGEPNGKREAWVILDAAPGARLHLGLRPDTTIEVFEAAVMSGHAVEHMVELEVEAGDVIAVPSGCAHAIGAGIYLWEVQQPSELTYRLYDYDRVGPDGKRRELHLEKGLAAIHPELRPGRQRAELLAEEGASRRFLLCDMGAFVLERWEVEGRLEIPLAGLAAVFAWKGEAKLGSADERRSLAAGRSLLATARPTEPLVVTGAATLLVARPRLPSA